MTVYYYQMFIHNTQNILINNFSKFFKCPPTNSNFENYTKPVLETINRKVEILMKIRHEF